MRLPMLLVVLAAGSAEADRLVDLHPVARGDYLAPRFSPDGRELLLTGPQLRGLYVVPIASSAPVRTLTGDAEAGIHARWQADGTVAYRALRAGTRRDLVVDRAGRVRAAAGTAPVVLAKDDRMYIDRAGHLVQVGSGDRFFGPIVAPDGDKVVFQGLATGLYVYARSTGALVHVGPGTAPAWSPDSRRLVYEVTEDDGHDIVASDLYLYDLAADRTLPITATDRVIERRPSFSPTGTEIAFDDNTGSVLVGRLEVP